MTQQDLISLQLRYAHAVYLAEKHRQEGEVLHQQLLAAARADAITEFASPKAPTHRPSSRTKRRHKGYVDGGGE